MADANTGQWACHSVRDPNGIHSSLWRPLPDTLTSHHLSAVSGTCSWPRRVLYAAVQQALNHQDTAAGRCSKLDSSM